MWSVEDIECMNPPALGQERSPLSVLLETASATADDLVLQSTLLESYPDAHVLVSWQLPYSVHIPDGPIRVRGFRKDVSLDLRFSPRTGWVDQIGRFRILTERNDAGETLLRARRAASFTQVLGVLRLWSPRDETHRRYFACVTPNGLRNDPIGRTGNWMDTPDASMQYPLRRRAPLKPHAFEVDLARRLVGEAKFAMQLFLQAYCAASLQPVPDAETLYGYFAMTDPGRLAFATAPQPVLGGLIASPASPSTRAVSLARLEAMLMSSLAVDDRVLRQLMAMNRLLRDGEPELALVGAVAAIEWFLNKAYGNGARAAGAKKAGSFSIKDLSDWKVMQHISDEKRHQLLAAARRRNQVVHGPPPHREFRNHIGPLTAAEVDDVLDLAMDTYRTINQASINDA